MTKKLILPEGNTSSQTFGKFGAMIAWTINALLGHQWLSNLCSQIISLCEFKAWLFEMASENETARYAVTERKKEKENH